MLEIFQNSVTEKMGTSKARWSRFLLFCKWGTAGVLHHAILSVLWPPLLLVGDSILCKRQKRFPIRQFKRTLAVLSRFVLRVFLFSWEGGGLLSFRLEKGRRALIRMPVLCCAVQSWQKLGEGSWVLGVHLLPHWLHGLQFDHFPSTNENQIDMLYSYLCPS